MHIDSLFATLPHLESQNETSSNCDKPRANLKKKIIAFSKIPFLKIAVFFQQVHNTQIPLKLQYLEYIVTMASGVFSSFTKLSGMTNGLLNLVKNVSQAVLGFLLKSKFVYQVLNAIKLLPIIAIPFAIYDILVNFIQSIKRPISEKIDALLQIVADVGIIGECIATFAHGLERVGAVSLHAIRWTTPLFAVSLALSVATAIAYAKGLVESAWTLRQLSKKVQSTSDKKQIEDFRPLFEYLENKNNRFLRKQFRIDPAQLRDKLATAWKNAQEVLKKSESTELEKQKSVQKLSKIVKSMKQQTISQIAIRSLLISSCLFGIVGGFVLLFTPAAPVAYGLMVGGVTLSLVSVGIGIYCNKRFRKNLKIQQKSAVKEFVERRVTCIKGTWKICTTKLFNKRHPAAAAAAA